MKTPAPDLTLPVGFGDAQFQSFVASKLDDHFESEADRRMNYCLEGCRFVMEHGRRGHPGAEELAFNLAKAAAHWRTVAQDRRSGVELVLVTEGVELVEDLVEAPAGA